MIEWMLILSGGVFRVVEALKLGIIASLQSRFKFSDEIYAALVVTVSLGLGVFAAGIGGANALALVPENSWTAQIPLWVGTLAAGLLIGLGTNVIHEVGEFFSLFKQRPAVQGTATVLRSVTVAEGAPVTTADVRQIVDDVVGEAFLVFAEGRRRAEEIVDDKWKPTGDAQAAAEGKPVPNYQG